MPQGQFLPERPWRARHRGIVILLWLHAAGLTAFALGRGYGLGHALFEGALVAAPTVLACVPRLGRKLRCLAASFALITASAVLVHIWGGAIEAHFHFFVVIPILILYQDWASFLLALGYVVVHHGVLGALEPSSVYNHPDAIADPWGWALIHGAFVLAASTASVVSWSANKELLHEPLTKLPGRNVLMHRLEVALDRRESRGGAVAVIVLDLDRFKRVNDTLGHAAGDELLVAVGRRIRGCVRARDTVSRLGGDEFAVVCEDVLDEEGARAISRRITAALREPFTLAGGQVECGASLGIGFATRSGVNAEILLADADAAMYRAKGERAGECVLFDEAMRAEDADRLALEAALGRALERGEMRVVYQPIVQRRTGSPVAMEALVRWQRPRRGLVSPADFIPMAEQTGLILPLGRWVLEQACAEAASWGPGAPFVTVNLSPRQITQHDFVASVADVLAETGLEPDRLGLEVTETVLVDEFESAAGTLRALKALGVRLLLDDFGTGYSSLSYLKRFPIDVLKVDRSFVASLGDAAEDDTIVAAMVGIARGLGMDLVAEGVETEQQLARLGLLGCELAQGYYFGQPQPAAQARLLLETVERQTAWERPTA